MNKFTYLGQELDPSQEHELFSENEHGFKVTVVFKAENWRHKDGTKKGVDIFNNCTEVHSRYKSLGKTQNRCALESDIHRTGGTVNIDEIESINIELADETAENW